MHSNTRFLATGSLIVFLAAAALPAQRGTLTQEQTDRRWELERELQSARITAVSANQPMRVMFNCPSAQQYRMVELIGTPLTPAAADGVVGRCSTSTYPFPAPDNNPISRPNNDGPLRLLPTLVTITTSTTIEFWPDGSAHTNTGGTNPWPPIASPGTNIILTRSGKTKTILVNGIGKIQLIP